MKQPSGKCVCGGDLVLLTTHLKQTAPGAVTGAVCCSDADCSKLVKFFVPNSDAITRGQELAERFGW